jgi:multiple sugar transport system permease protein
MRRAPGFWQDGMRRAEARSAFLFLLPSILGFICFLLFPLVASFVMSFTNWKLIGTPKFVGFANYARLFTKDPSFYKVLGNTLFFTVEYLVLNIVIAVGLAVWVSSLKRGKTLFRVIFFLPTFAPLVGISVVWLLIFTPNGFFDSVIQALGLPIPNLLLNPTGAMQIIVIVSLWAGVGYNLILFNAAFELVPKSFIEAAMLDGAGPWRRFWHIRLPLISPTLFFGTVMTGITALQVFDQIYALTRGGPGSATATLGFSIYQNGFSNYLMGYAAAISWVMFAIIMALTAFQFRMQRRWVNYGV